MIQTRPANQRLPDGAVGRCQDPDKRVGEGCGALADHQYPCSSWSETGCCWYRVATELWGAPPGTRLPPSLSFLAQVPSPPAAMYLAVKSMSVFSAIRTARASQPPPQAGGGGGGKRLQAASGRMWSVQRRREKPGLKQSEGYLRGASSVSSLAEPTK